MSIIFKKVLEDNNDLMLKLAKRRGTRYGNPNLREIFLRLSNHYKEGAFISDQDLINSVGELFNKIRNNLFHGVKNYDDREDFELINLINPILLQILEICEPS
jgi:hypothetical protein